MAAVLKCKNPPVEDICHLMAESLKKEGKSEIDTKKIAL